MFDQLKPEYIHILLNPYVTHGLPIAFSLLGAGLALRNRSITIAALILVVVTCALVYPTVEIGEIAFDRISALADDTAQEWLDEHLRRAHLVAPFFYGCGILSLLALLVPIKFPKARMPLALATLTLSGALCGAAGYTAYAGGRVAHVELRRSEGKKGDVQQAPDVSPK